LTALLQRLPPPFQQAIKLSGNYGATELYDAGVDPEQIRRVMGHTTLAMTEHYNRTNGKIIVNKEIWNKICGVGLCGLMAKSVKPLILLTK